MGAPGNTKKTTREEDAVRGAEASAEPLAAEEPETGSVCLEREDSKRVRRMLETHTDARRGGDRY
ncbi:hypothetical protein EYF80_036235 [Liparis tanakae]|uniref:Uncharacterized protein n=1 Tax=Liparis tanakae TaxID=230148 RepID=A0A4Z2GJU9_9TELE|nr:hypothetical protein EYF80_036235 [Liparis tanakae]